MQNVAREHGNERCSTCFLWADRKRLDRLKLVFGLEFIERFLRSHHRPAQQSSLITCQTK